MSRDVHYPLRSRSCIRGIDRQTAPQYHSVSVTPPPKMQARALLTTGETAFAMLLEIDVDVAAVNPLSGVC